jgi:hypothetical protein
MKSIKLFLTAILFFVLGFAQAQNDYNPWKKYGYTPPKALTLSDGKYQEFFDADTIVQIGSVLFNTVTNEVVAFIKYDTTYSEATLEPHIISRWLSPDPLAQERPSWTPYNFCSDNPINRIDPDGRLDDIVITGENNSSVTLKTDMIDIKVNASSLGINFGGNHVLQGEDVLSAGLDIVGVFDVSGISDGFGAGLAWKKGDYWSATISGLSILPFGDFLKVGKIGKDIKIIENAIDATKRIGPAGDAGATVTKQIPSNWSMKTSKNGQGTVFKDPNNPTGNNVRVQGGNPNSPNTSQQAPYVKQTSNGKTVDVNGKQVDPKSPESHIPKSDFKYKK